MEIPALFELDAAMAVTFSTCFGDTCQACLSTKEMRRGVVGFDCEVVVVVVDAMAIPALLGWVVDVPAKTPLTTFETEVRALSAV